MSFNRDNVVWPGPEGRWRIGFYEVVWTGEDPEWDVEYNYGRFGWVGEGATAQEAIDAYPGANPGGSSILDQPDNCRVLDTMWEAARDRQREGL